MAIEQVGHQKGDQENNRGDDDTQGGMADALGLHGEKMDHDSCSVSIGVFVFSFLCFL